MTTPVEQALARRILARRRLLRFTMETYPNYKPGWVHEDICLRLERFSDAVIAGESPRLMLLVPPRHGKSELASIRMPAWHLGRAPRHEIINVGYNLDLPMKFSRRVREVMRDPVYAPIFPKASLDPSSQGLENWNTFDGGGFQAAGVGGGITGKGAHVLIIDDPIKNQEEADSILVRDRLWDWYQSTAYTRLAPGGGVLVIECLTGDTPVLMGDGSERRLDTVAAGDVVATMAAGRLVSSRVAAVKLSGRDSVLKITMSSGRVIRANGRHPFLVETAEGALRWVRARSLTLGHTIVAVPGSGGNIAGSSASKKGVSSLPSVGGSAPATTTNGSGRQATVLRSSGIPTINAIGTSSTGTGLLSKISAVWSASKAGAARFARKCQWLRSSIGATASVWTTRMSPGKSGSCSATGAMLPQDTFVPKPTLGRSRNIYDFTLSEVVGIEADGEADVYDLSIEGTENFIASGLVVHNTWWNDDDLAGRLQQHMSREDADQFEVIRYPAVSDCYEYRHREMLSVVRSDVPLEAREEADLGTEEFELLRRPNEALHEERYPLDALKRIKATLHPRIWSALYQQNPVPDEGMYFKKEFFRYHPALPRLRGLNIFTAWDFAITEKQQNDYTVGATLLQDHTDTLYVAEINRFKEKTYGIIDHMLDTAQRWMMAGNDYTIGVEDGQIWKTMEPVLRREMQKRRIYPSIMLLKPLTDKLARARPLQGRMQQGRIVFLEDASWLSVTEQEMLRFPAGVHDDIVDALAWAARVALEREPPPEPRSEQHASWKDRLAEELVSSSRGGYMSA